MTFYAQEIDVCPAYGWQAGPSADVVIKTLRNRREKRNLRGSQMQHTYILPFQNVRDREYLEYIKSAFMAMGGPHDTFLVKDFWDHSASSVPIGPAPEGREPIQLVKMYTFGFASYSRVITKPVAESVVIRQDGAIKPGVLDDLTGLFTPDTDWAESQMIFADFEFRVPVRFSDMSMLASIDSRFGTGDYAMNGSVTLLEVIGE